MEFTPSSEEMPIVSWAGRVEVVLRYLVPSIHVLPFLIGIAGDVFVLRPVQTLSLKHTGLPMAIIATAFLIVPLYQRFHDAWKTCVISWGGAIAGLLIGFVVAPLFAGRYPARSEFDVAGIVAYFAALGTMASLGGLIAAIIHRVVVRIRKGPRPLFRGAKWIEVPLILVASVLLHELSSWRNSINNEYRTTRSRFGGTVRHQEMDKVRATLDRFPQVLNPDDSDWAVSGPTSYRNPVNVAARTGNVELIELLLSRGASHTIASACVMGDTAEVDRLIARHEKFPDSSGALHSIVSAKCHDYIPYLVKKGADPDAATFVGSPLQIAAWKDDEVAARLLLEAGAGVSCTYKITGSSRLKHALEIAAEADSVSVAKIIIEAGMQIDGDSLRAALGRGSPGVLELFIREGCAVTETDLARTREAHGRAKRAYERHVKMFHGNPPGGERQRNTVARFQRVVEILEKQLREPPGEARRDPSRSQDRVD